MSVQAMSWVWNHSQAEGTARLVLLAIADAANREGERAWISAKTIGEMCRVTSRTAQRKIAELVAIGELEKTGSRGERQANVYRLPKMKEGAQGGGSEPDRYDTPDVSRYDTPDVRQIVVYDKPGQPIRQTGSADTTLLSHTPINPSSSKELHPINNAHTHEAVGERQRPAPGRVNYSPAFEQFWEAYPRKEGKLDAYNAWRSASHFNSASHLIAAAGRYRDNPNRDPRYTKTPTRWLNTRGWEDGPAEPPRPTQPTRVPGWVERAQIAEQVNAQFLATHYQQENLNPPTDWIAGELQ